MVETFAYVKTGTLVSHLKAPCCCSEKHQRYWTSPLLLSYLGAAWQHWLQTLGSQMVIYFSPPPLTPVPPLHLIVLHVPHCFSHKAKWKAWWNKLTVGRKAFQSSLGEADLFSDLPCHWGLLWAVTTCSLTQSKPSVPQPGHQHSSGEPQGGFEEGNN